HGRPRHVRRERCQRKALSSKWAQFVERRPAASKERSMIAAKSWPHEVGAIDEDTLIPDLLRSVPHARIVLDRYGLSGCGGPSGPAESLGYFARAHEVPLEPLLAELRSEANTPAPSLTVLDQPKPHAADAIYRPFFK